MGAPDAPAEAEAAERVWPATTTAPITTTTPITPSHNHAAESRGASARLRAGREDAAR
jgi:hypothetical protein